MLQLLLNSMAVFSIVFYGFMLMFGRTETARRGLVRLAGASILTAVITPYLLNAWVLVSVTLGAIIALLLILKILQILLGFTFGRTVADHTVSSLLVKLISRR